ncbi:hypothetical protein Bhyg_07911, partial [Pseudolycoriella hygida]
NMDSKKINLALHNANAIEKSKLAALLSEVNSIVNTILTTETEMIHQQSSQQQQPDFNVGPEIIADNCSSYY